MIGQVQYISAAVLHQLMTIAKLDPQAQWFYSYIIYGNKSRPQNWPCIAEVQQTSVLSLIQIQGFLSSTTILILFAGKYSHTDYAATYRPYGLLSLRRKKCLQAPSLCGQALMTSAISFLQGCFISHGYWALQTAKHSLEHQVGWWSHEIMSYYQGHWKGFSTDFAMDWFKI